MKPLFYSSPPRFYLAPPKILPWSALLHPIQSKRPAIAFKQWLNCQLFNLHPHGPIQLHHGLAFLLQSDFLVNRQLFSWLLHRPSFFMI